jgi:sarcosine oxidase
MVERRAEVLVVGAGVVGLAAAWALARSGRDVLALEQFRVGHDRGSSHGSSRIFRLAYDDPQWVRLAQEALPLWRELEAESGVELLSLQGLLDTGRPAEPLREALEACGVSSESLDPAGVERRFGIRLRGPAIFQAEAGVAWAQRTLQALRRTVEVDEDTRVLALEPRDGGVRVETTRGPVEARVALVCAGPWARPLLATIGIELPVRVTRETVAYFRLAGDRPLPSIIDWEPPEGRGTQVYVLAAGGGLVKIGLHHAGAGADPDEAGEPDAEAVALASEWAARSLPVESADPAGADTCLYTTTDDERFLLERHGPVIVGSACSGHAFKFAPAVGVRLAALAEEALTS